MTIPDYQTCMRPVLAVHEDGREHSSREIRDAMVREFGVSEDERRQMLPSGKQPLFNNRVAWAVTYLAQAAVLRRTRRGYTQITERGRELLASRPERIGTEDLHQFPEFVAFITRGSGRSREQSSIAPAVPSPASGVLPTPNAANGGSPAAGATPNEIMDSAYRALRSALADELVERVKGQSAEFFEDLVLDVLTAMGYGGTRSDAAERLGRSGDGGIDGVIREDALGLDLIYVQAKRWENVVGRPVIQGFVGALHGAHADRGVLITTSHFSPEAISYAESVPARVILIDGPELADLMIDYGVGVTETTRYELKRIDGDYFPEEADGSESVSSEPSPEDLS